MEVDLYAILSKTPVALALRTDSQELAKSDSILLSKDGKRELLEEELEVAAGQRLQLD